MTRRAMLFHSWLAGRLPDYRPGAAALWLAWKYGQPPTPQPTSTDPKPTPNRTPNPARK